METKHCVACKSKIPEDALICAECGTRQDWLRHLQFSSVVLSLLVALVSVSGIAFPLVYKTFHTPEAKINLKLIRLESLEGTIILPPPTRERDNPSSTDPQPKNKPERGRRHGGRIIYSLTAAVLLTNKGDLAGAVIPKKVVLNGANGIIAHGVSEDVFTLEPKAYRLQLIRYHLQIDDSGVLPRIHNEEPLGTKGFKEMGCTFGHLDFEVLDHGAEAGSMRLDIEECDVEVHFVEESPSR